MADIDLKTATPDTSLPSTGFLFGADSQSAAAPSVYSTQTVATALLGSTSLTGATVTADRPVLNMAQTWNNAAVTFTGLKANITDTASNAASLLMDLQVGGVSQFSVGKAGLARPSGIALSADGFGGGNANWWSTNGLNLRTASSFSFSNDLFIARRAAANLRLGASDAAAPVAQTLSVQSVAAGTTNTAGTDFVIAGSQGTGTGAGGSIIFQVAPAGSSGSAQNALASYLALNSTKGGTAATGNNATLEFPFDAVGNAKTGFGVPYSGQIFIYGQGVPSTRILSSRIELPPASIFSWNSGADFLGSTDLILARDAANTLAQRNGANAQTKRLYGTYTDASNYRRLAMTMSTAGVAEIKPEGAGTGASGNVIHISGLPTSNPGPGILWNNAGTPAIGT